MSTPTPDEIRRAVDSESPCGSWELAITRVAARAYADLLENGEYHDWDGCHPFPHVVMRVASREVADPRPYGKDPKEFPDAASVNAADDPDCAQGFGVGCRMVSVLVYKEEK